MGRASFSAAKVAINHYLTKKKYFLGVDFRVRKGGFSALFYDVSSCVVDKDT